MAEHLSGAKSLKCMRLFAAFLTAAVGDDVFAAERKRNDVLARQFQARGAIYAAAKGIECVVDGWLSHCLFLVRLPMSESLAIDTRDGIRVFHSERRAVVVTGVKLRKVALQVEAAAMLRESRTLASGR